jgi:hypothetical protein
MHEKNLFKLQPIPSFQLWKRGKEYALLSL